MREVPMTTTKSIPPIEVKSTPTSPTGSTPATAFEASSLLDKNAYLEDMQWAVVEKTAEYTGPAIKSLVGTTTAIEGLRTLEEAVNEAKKILVWLHKQRA